MSQPILVGHSPEAGDRSVLEFAAQAARFTGAPLVVAVVDGGAAPPELPAGVDAEVRVLEHGTPAHALASAIEELRPAMVVLGASRRAHARLGSTAERVIHAASCPVAVVPHRHEPRGASGVRTIGAAFAPTPEGREALRAAAALASPFAARVRVVVALSPKHADEQGGMLARQHHDIDAADAVASRHIAEAEEEARNAIAELGGTAEVETDVLFQEPAHALVAASANLDLLVMGSRAHGAVRSVALGSVSRHVVSAASCPVIVLPRGTEGAVEALVSAARAGTSD